MDFQDRECRDAGVFGQHYVDWLVERVAASHQSAGSVRNSAVAVRTITRHTAQVALVVQNDHVDGDTVSCIEWHGGMVRDRTSAMDAVDIPVSVCGVLRDDGYESGRIQHNSGKGIFSVSISDLKKSEFGLKKSEFWSEKV